MKTGSRFIRVSLLITGPLELEQHGDREHECWYIQR